MTLHHLAKAIGSNGGEKALCISCLEPFRQRGTHTCLISSSPTGFVPSIAIILGRLAQPIAEAPMLTPANMNNRSCCTSPQPHLLWRAAGAAAGAAGGGVHLPLHLLHLGRLAGASLLARISVKRGF